VSSSHDVRLEFSVVPIVPATERIVLVVVVAHEVAEVVASMKLPLLARKVKRLSRQWRRRGRAEVRRRSPR